MLYRFKSQATADIVMLQPTGEQLLTIIGKLPEHKGVITVAQMPAALAALAQAVIDSEAAPPDTTANEANDNALESDAVRLRQRAAPLIGMLKECVAANKDIVWGV